MKRQPSVVSWSSREPRSQALSGLAITHRARVIDSTPPATKTSPSPTAIAWAPAFTAWRPDPHSRLNVLPARSNARRAHTIARRPRHLDRGAGQQRGHPRDVAVVLSRLIGAAEDHVLDERRLDTGTVDDRLDDHRGKVVRPDGGERATVAADRGTDRSDDPGLAKRSIRISGHRPRLFGGQTRGGGATARARARASATDTAQ